MVLVVTAWTALLAPTPCAWGLLPASTAALAPTPPPWPRLLPASSAQLAATPPPLALRHQTPACCVLQAPFQYARVVHPQPAACTVPLGPTPLGWAALFSALLVMLALMLRSLGRSHA